MTSLLHKIPFLRIIFFFAIGVFAYVKGLNFGFVSILTISGFMFLFLHLLIMKQKEDALYSYRWSFGAAIAAFMVAFGMIFAHQTKILSVDTESKCYVASVSSSPKLMEDVVKCNMQLTEVDEHKLRMKSNPFPAVVYLPVSYESLRLGKGDSIMFYAEHGLLSMRNPEVRVANGKAVTMFVDDENWELMATSSAVSANAVRDSMVGMLKKKDVLMKN